MEKEGNDWQSICQVYDVCVARCAPPSIEVSIRLAPSAPLFIESLFDLWRNCEVCSKVLVRFRQLLKTDKLRVYAFVFRIQRHTAVQTNIL